MNNRPPPHERVLVALILAAGLILAALAHAGANRILGTPERWTYDPDRLEYLDTLTGCRVTTAGEARCPERPTP